MSSHRLIPVPELLPVLPVEMPVRRYPVPVPVPISVVFWGDGQALVDLHRWPRVPVQSGLPVLLPNHDMFHDTGMYVH